MKPRALLLCCTLFAVAFGYVEAAVVVYLREIAYPEGFRFPLREIEPRLLWTEVAREAATLLLLLAVAWLACRRPLRRFAAFAFCFGVWDLAYYLALKVLLGWPQSLLDWDILFLIPLPWTAPVLAPVLVSLALIGAGAAILRAPPERDPGFLRPVDWGLEILAGLAVLASFLWNVPAVAAQQAPAAYPWGLFLPGWLGGVGWFVWRWFAHASRDGER
ncbi:MAG: hypothetical protein ACYTEZ_07365 [Planctomycetota bacterium]